MWLKQKLAWLLIVLMSINSFAAIVGDNDGAAFITKAEFESLKNDFQTQINRYNSSLDSKIDGAIATYLEGVSVAKADNVKILVNNYQDIRWIREFLLYGKYKKWSDNDTMTSQLSDDWYVPALNEKRHNLRTKQVYIYDTWTTAWEFTTNGFVFNATKSNAGVTINGSRGNDANPACPVLVVWMYQDANDWKIVGLRNVFVMAPYLVVNPHDAVTPGATGYYLYQLGDYKPFFKDLTINAPALNQIFNYTIKYGMDSATGTDRQFNARISTEQVDWPAAWNVLLINAGDRFSSQTKLNPAWNQIQSDGFFDASPALAATWHKVTTEYDRQINTLLFGMFGKDNIATANVAKYKSVQGEKFRFDWTGYDQSALISG